MAEDANGIAASARAAPGTRPSRAGAIFGPGAATITRSALTVSPPWTASEKPAAARDTARTAAFVQILSRSRRTTSASTISRSPPRSE